MDRITLLKGITLIETAISKKFDDAQVKLYEMLLSDLTEEQFRYGIEELLKSRVYTNIPSIAEIRQYALQTREDDLVLKVALAKEKLKNAVGAVGTYKTVAFDDPTIHLVIQSMGGWAKVGMMNIDEFNNYLKWDFPKIYKAFSTRKNSNIPLLLEGRGEDKKPIFIGEEKKVLAWQNAYTSMIESKNAQVLELENKRSVAK